MLQKGLTVSVDCRWSSRRNGKEATVSVICCDTNKIIMVYHVMRCRTIHTPEEVKNCKAEQLQSDQWLLGQPNFHGNSKTMEGFGVDKCFAKLKELKLNITHLVHDKDATTRNNVKKYYPDCIELLDM